MSNYQPLSVRRGLRQPLVGVEGVPATVQHAVLAWLRRAYRYVVAGNPGYRTGEMFRVAVHAQVVLVQATGSGYLEQLLTAVQRNDDVFLDVLDGTLFELKDPKAAELESLLALGGSAWAVGPTGRSIQRRVEPTTAAAAQQAMAPADAASDELAEAWAKVYGLSPDPSDAWDHAIKAVEAVTIPIVVPAKAKATLGDVLGQLKANPAGWTFALQSSSTTVGNVETIEAMLRMMWPNPDRHGGTGATRVPSLEEAAAVVQLAVTVLSWCRSGAFAKK